MSNYYPVILCGGSGTRLWPLSRKQHPKQFIKLFNDHSLLQNTIFRLPEDTQSPIFICNKEHRFIVAEQTREIKIVPKGIILEPVGRNTAPAIALAAFKAMNDNPDAVLLILPSDQNILDVNAFRTAIDEAHKLALKDKLVTFGIVPTEPHTGYGYIKRGSEISSNSNHYNVSEFVEKPDVDIAKGYVESGDYYWNSGMFVFKANTYLAELKKFRPDIYYACALAIKNVKHDSDFVKIDAEAFAACPNESVDYAVMEHSTNAAVVPLAAGWSVVGSWSSLWQESEKDENNNAVKGDVITESTRNSFILSSGKLVATIGLDNVVIVETPDAILVADKDKVQSVKRIVSKLETAQRTEHIHNRAVYRPWGRFDSIDMAERFQVKRITVKPGAKLSVQKHHHRSEHWIVVLGTA